jgi:hypothetical protein
MGQQTYLGDNVSDDFIDSQVKYYQQHLNCGPSRDWNMITGLYNFYKGLQNERRKSFTDK